jgi:hypothetical protein
MTDLRASRISVGIHAVFGFLAGYLYLYLINGIYVAAVAIALLLVAGFISEKIVKKDMVKKAGIKWWLGNGGIHFILVWAVTWIYLFNI